MRVPGLVLGSLLTAALLSACGQVAVFGHVVGERPPAEETGRASVPATTNVPATASAKGGAEAQPAEGAAESPKLASASAPPATQSSRVVKALRISIAPKATENVASDAAFSPDALLDAIRAELRSRNLLDERSSPATDTPATDVPATNVLEIQVSEVALRSTTNAVVFGYKMMASTLIADLRLADADTEASAPFHIAAQARLTLSTRPVDGDAEQRKAKEALGPLYRRFAVLTADRLEGIESKPDPATSGEIPRF